MTSGASDAYSALREGAQRRWHAAHGGVTRVVVQVGHCSEAVGAQQTAGALAESLSARPDFEVVVGGCDGACFNAPQVLLIRPDGESHRYGCVTPAGAQELGRSLAAGEVPTADDNGTESFFSAQQRLVTARYGLGDGTDIDEYLAPGGGYGALALALSMPPEDVIAEVLEAGLLGRGGAYFPAARKWQAARSVDKTPRYLVVNCEEGEPGIFKDRHIMEAAPHALLEGLAIAAYASGAETAYIYINAEADLSAARVRQALDQAREHGLAGEDILGSGFSLQVELRRGAGGYVCGEETTLLNTVEGDRRVPRLRPPFPTDSGLWARPTVINNTETLVNVPIILGDEAAFDAFMGSGIDTARGTKLVCLSGSVRRPGMAEVPMGATLCHIIHEVGGGVPEGRALSAVAVGGPSSGVLPLSMLDTPIGPGMLHESGVVLGAGGVIAIDGSVSIMEVVRGLAAYNAAESCGKCTPCREGTPRIVAALDRLLGGAGEPDDLEDLRYLAEVVGAASLCGLGQMAGGPINSALHFFGDELARLAGVSS